MTVLAGANPAAPGWLEAFEQGILLYWRTLGRMRGMAIHDGDLEWVGPTPGNRGPARIYRVRLDPATADRRIEEILAAMRAGALPDGMLITPGSTPADLVERLRRKGFSIDTSGVGMNLELGGVPATGASLGGASSNAAASAPGLLASTSPVKDDAALASWAWVVNAGLFGGELLSLEQFGDILSLDYARFFLTRLGGVPASACLTLTGSADGVSASAPAAGGDLATLEMVATVPEYRRKGLATAAVSAALDDLRRHGVRTVTLRAEPDAVRLYEKLGFRECCRRVVAMAD